MIDRFKGDDGRRLLTQALADQVIVNGNHTIADELFKASELQQLQGGDVLVSQDSKENDIYFIISGSFEIEANGRWIASRHAGTHVGEMSVIDSKAARCATVRAAETAVVAKVTEPAFSQIATAFPELWRRLAMELCGRLRNRNGLIRPPNDVPNIFICSSAESFPIAEKIQLCLDHHQSIVKIWADQVFRPTKHTMEDLEREVRIADFAIAVVMGEDVVLSRKKKSVAPRDNVVFELGLFMGQLGRERTFIVVPRGVSLKMPSDLFGLKPLEFVPPTDPSSAALWAAAIGPVCTQIKAAIGALPPR